MDEAAKARAEAAAARRAKILARQKDRITSITGAYSGQSEQEQQEQRSSSSQLQPPASGDVAAAAPAPAASGSAAPAAVKQSQAMRLLSALLIAYAALSGWQMGLSPAVLLVVTNLSVVAAALMLLHTSAAGRKLLAGQQQGGSGEDGQVPMSLRSFDFLSLVPGLRQLLTALAGYKHLASAMSEDFAVYVVGLGMLTAMLSLQPPLVKV
ncbi:hypothetical protein OEZ85_008226 [Tetradesmus obliquus]|uniref:Reticulon domain-containing protein n=1 Tax=Tetradesmus obliquus TaxID=3088 RepID=A0ABY8TI85_TETOB|nr:hypothetical protein OEZ85_008226 [Tetradesmus obliquus]